MKIKKIVLLLLFASSFSLTSAFAAEIPCPSIAFMQANSEKLKPAGMITETTYAFQIPKFLQASLYPWVIGVNLTAADKSQLQGAKDAMQNINGIENEKAKLIANEIYGCKYKTTTANAYIYAYTYAF